MPDRLRAAGGDPAKLALDAKLVDKLAPRDEVRQRIITLVGEDKENHTFKQVTHADYLKAKGGDRTGATGRAKAVAVVVAKGTILDGSQPAGTIGGDSTARLLRRARESESVSAVVLRVDSPGGSAFASDIIRRECELVRKAGKPLVVSMGTVAASGGYWISTASDEIWAAPETITGSIGIFGVFPSIHKPLAKYLGVHTDGAGTTRFTGALRPDRPLDGGVADMIQQGINDGYEDFLARVAEARKLTREQVDAIGRGRIWSGEDAKAHGLVDQLGGLPAAIESAAKRAKLEKGYRVWYVEKEKSFREQVLEMLTASASAAVRLVAGTAARDLRRTARWPRRSRSRRRCGGSSATRSRWRAGTTPRGSTRTACAETSSPLDCCRPDPAVEVVVLAPQGLQLLAVGSRDRLLLLAPDRVHAGLQLGLVDTHRGVVRVLVVLDAEGLAQRREQVLLVHLRVALDGVVLDPLRDLAQVVDRLVLQLFVGVRHQSVLSGKRRFSAHGGQVAYSCRWRPDA